LTKSEKVQFVIDTLERLYSKTPIPLHHYDVYTLLVAVALSAQTTDKKVNEVTPKLFEVAPDPYKMVALAESRIKYLIREIGLSSTKAKNLKKMAQMLVDEYDGCVPQTFDALERLPGVGHKTAAVVMSQGFGFAAFPVDTHIHRLMWRWGLSDGSSVLQTEKDAKRLFPEHLWNKLHLQMIYYGREYSPARGFNINKDVISQKIGRKSFLQTVGL